MKPKMETLNFSSVERYLTDRQLPSLKFYYSLIMYYYLMFIPGLVIFELIFYYSEDQVELNSTYMMMFQSRIIPMAFGVLVFVHCLMKHKSKKDNVISMLGIAIAALIYIRICAMFVIKLTQPEIRYDFMFVWNFAEITFFSYLAMITFLIVGRRAIRKIEWKVFDIAMMAFAFVAFTGVVMQKVFGDSAVAAAITLLLGAIAFAMKFSRLTCEYLELKNERTQR